VGLSLLTLPFLTGCGLSSHVAVLPSARTLTPAPPSVTPADPTVAVRQSPLYREAQRDCRARQFVHAAGLLDRLAETPGVTPAQAAFCRVQRAICLRDAGMPIPASRPVSSTAAVSAASAPLTPEQADCGPRALAMACDKIGVKGADVAALRRAAGTTGRGTTLAGLALAAKSVGLKAKGEQVDLPALKRLPGPAIAWVDGDHYLAVLSVDGDTATVHDPNYPREEEIPTGALLARSGGVLLTLRR
jgi:hypothetical protein